MNYLKGLKNMENPGHSYIFYALLVTAVLLYDANYVLHYLIILIISLFIYCHPSFSSYFR